MAMLPRTNHPSVSVRDGCCMCPLPADGTASCLPHCLCCHCHAGEHLTLFIVPHIDGAPVKFVARS